MVTSQRNVLNPRWRRCSRFSHSVDGHRQYGYRDAEKRELLENEIDLFAQLIKFSWLVYL